MTKTKRKTKRKAFNPVRMWAMIPAEDGIQWEAWNMAVFRKRSEAYKSVIDPTRFRVVPVLVQRVK